MVSNHKEKLIILVNIKEISGEQWPFEWIKSLLAVRNCGIRLTLGENLVKLDSIGRRDGLRDKLPNSTIGRSRESRPEH